MRTLFAVVSLAVALFSAPSAANNDLPAAAQQVMNSIDSEKIRATVKYLADDKLEGRGTGQKGGDVAADWIAQQLKSYGLQPAGDNGTFFQNVKFYGITTDQKATQYAFVPKSGEPLTLKFADDYVATDETHSDKSVINAPNGWSISPADLGNRPSISL